MATENRAVMVYLPADIEQYFTQYCTEYDITRKDKESGDTIPSLGTGIIAYLKSQILGIAPNDTSSAVVAPIDRLTTELAQLRLEFTELTQLRSEVAKITELSEEVAEIKKQLADRPPSTSTAPLVPKEPNQPPYATLAKLAASGSRAKAIAEELNQLGYTTAQGYPFTRDNLNSLIRSDASLKQTYDLAANKPTTATQEPS